MQHAKDPLSQNILFLEVCTLETMPSTEISPYPLIQSGFIDISYLVAELKLRISATNVSQLLSLCVYHGDPCNPRGVKLCLDVLCWQNKVRLSIISLDIVCLPRISYN